MDTVLYEFATMLLRWLHVIAAIAWIGESFYFVMLDNSLRDPLAQEDKDAGVFGEQWAVHGGGFYHNLKFMTAPAKLPEHLHWSYLKAYTTWIVGFLLFLILYVRNPSMMMNPNPEWGWVAALNETPWLVSVSALIYLLLGWVIYNELCKRVSPNMEKDGILGVCVAIMIAVFGYVAVHMFSGSTAFLLTGAVMATAMSANVYFWIIPGQARMVNAMKAGEEPNPLDGKRGKQRSVHNTYFTLPVVFLMLSTHFRTLFADEHAYLLLILFILAGAFIRQFFVLMHAGQIKHWYYVVGGLFIVAAFAVVAYGKVQPAGDTSAELEPAPEQVTQIIQNRCVSCHTGPNAPKGIQLDDESNIPGLKNHIQQVVKSGFMPMGNATGMTDEEREIIAEWSE